MTTLAAVAEITQRNAEFSPDILAYMIGLFLALLFGAALGRGINGEKLRFTPPRSLLWGGCAILAVYALTPLVVSFLIKHLFTEGDLTRHGQFGDLFGSVNALFSCMAFIAVLVSLHLQQINQNKTLQIAAVSGALSSLPARIESERTAIAHFAECLELEIGDTLSNAYYATGALNQFKRLQTMVKQEIKEAEQNNGQVPPELAQKMATVECLIVSATRLRDDLKRQDLFLGQLAQVIVDDSTD